MGIKDKMLLLIALDDYESSKPGYKYSLEFEEYGIVRVCFYDEEHDITTLSFSTSMVPRKSPSIKQFNDSDLFFEAVREIVYGLRVL